MEHLKKFRLSLGISGLDMAAKIGVSFSLYEKIERGERNASNTFLKKFKRTFPDYDLNLFFTQEVHEVCSEVI